jgi:hypothetical protein
VYRWDFDGLARQQFKGLSPPGQAELIAFMNAVILVDPMEYQRHVGEASDPGWATEEAGTAANVQGLNYRG